MEKFVWSACRSSDPEAARKAQDRAYALWILQSIAEKHGGTVDVDIDEMIIRFNIPRENEDECAMEVEEALGYLEI